MSTAAPTVVVGARVAPRYREQLRSIADRNASTISRTAARFLEERLDDLMAMQLAEHESRGH